MADFSLYKRFLTQGTLNEPSGIPDPRHALPSTVNWMRSLAMVIEDQHLNFSTASDFYSRVRKEHYSEKCENSVFEHLILALHQLSALQAMTKTERQADVARVASVGWYYGIYAAATAMVAAQDGSIQETHRATANTWDRQFAERKLVMHPFDLRVSTLVPKNRKAEVDAIRQGPATNLVKRPQSIDAAHQQLCGYLSGSAGWWAWTIEENVKKSRDFLALDLLKAEFKTNKAKSLRDARLEKQPIAFLHQAFRYRGKANYREALYLAHGSSVEHTVAEFVADLATVLEGFVAMAGSFVSQRLGKVLMDSFLADLQSYRSFGLDPYDVWSK